ncbi:MAG: hypothetical protein NT030_01235 [Candidatus Saganbacteria bacterium]|nr:hypothetical protein [Candidatus Saganbacteria bacterium]
MVVNGDKHGKNITLGCWTGVEDFANSYYVSGNIYQGTTEAYILVGITTEAGEFGGALGYILKKPSGTNPAGTYYFSGLPNGTYYVGAMQLIGWEWDDPVGSPEVGDWFGTSEAIVVTNGNQTGKNITLLKLVPE